VIREAGLNWSALPGAAILVGAVFNTAGRSIAGWEDFASRLWHRDRWEVHKIGRSEWYAIHQICIAGGCLHHLACATRMPSSGYNACMKRGADVAKGILILLFFLRRSMYEDKLRNSSRQHHQPSTKNAENGTKSREDACEFVLVRAR
jgi:hypothetical protein